MHTKSHSSQRPEARDRTRRAFTLVELVVALAIASLVLAVVALLSFYSSRSFAAMTNYVDLDKSSRDALDRMTREIRMTRLLVSYATNRLTFEDFDGEKLVYNWDPGTRLLTRTKTNTTSKFMSECDYLKFGIFKRTPFPGATNVFYPAAANEPTNCKLIDVTWRCSRTIFGRKVNTESVQTAQVVMRNKR